MRAERIALLSRSCLWLVLFFCSLTRCAADEVYQLGPDSQEQDGIPHGKIEQFSWTSKIFHGTTRDCWVYVPAQYDPNTPACVMVFQDGGGFQNPKGAARADRLRQPD